MSNEDMNKAITCGIQYVFDNDIKEYTSVFTLNPRGCQVKLHRGAKLVYSDQEGEHTLVANNDDHSVRVSHLGVAVAISCVRRKLDVGNTTTGGFSCNDNVYSWEVIRTEKNEFYYNIKLKTVAEEKVEDEDPQ
jgi:hypothetical protein